MFFTKVELHNFGIYKGTHEMTLTDKIGDRNITLIGGLNGRGKTTFHDAVLLALYGKQALKYIQEKEKSYEKLLLDHINKHATDDETYVAVTLVLEDETEIRIKRMWKARGKKIDQQTIVEKNGIADKYLGDNWSYYIEEILPFGIARFFFFNNEKITQLADDSSFEQIKSSIKSAIGVSTIEKTIEHIDEVIRRKKSALKSFETSELNQEYQEVEREISEIDQRLEEAQRELNKLELQCQKLAIQIEAKENEFWSSGGDLSRNRDAIKAEMNRISDVAEQIQQEIMQLASSAATPLALCKDLVVQSYNEEQEQLQGDVKRHTDTVVNNSYQRVISRLNESNLPLEVLDLVKRIISDELVGHISEAVHENRISMSPVSLMLYEKLISEFFPGISQKIIGLVSSSDAQEAEYLSLDAHLGAADDKTLAMQLYEALKSIEKEKALADADYQRKSDSIESMRRQREILVGKRIRLIKGMAEKENTNDDNMRIIKYAAMSIETLTEFKKRLQKEKVERLSNTATTCFQTLVEKNSLAKKIDINPDTLDVTIVGVDGNELLKSQLSAGEQQMFAVAIVWALALSSGYNAPVIVDTPMARLDSSHRTNFVTKYLPAASSQVMVLSTDEEIYGRYLDMVRENVVDYYTLLYREEERCTSIVQGYFGEA
ncbi:DNA sulfur modification protein DndD [Anaerotignum lactatifermentans]|uniref:Nuclease SbcCD subunit C n=1 Tax=Anaerotignum lactatifermentans TaxID=160404 RepID=A0ABS2GC91_9FIRM|nr:DNA sulfur modification protein DndD [Anaerotignum lactatifermentans]MBM6878104.1 DNA sulfur modification protein DndD [Anaerotignum lactatifermentans]MBM6951281.1 DNA sulfur modification protein DndD [Anaerotignum lactatifermentans]